MPLQRLDLGIEAGNVLGPPVIGEVFEAKPLEHCRPLLGPALLRIERHDAPGNQVVAGEENLCRLAAWLTGSSRVLRHRCGRAEQDPRRQHTHNEGSSPSQRTVVERESDHGEFP